MGRNPKSTHLKQLTGNPGGRRIQNNPQPLLLTKMPSCPDYITGHGRMLWKDLGPKLIAVKILTELDISMFGTLCVAYARMQDALDELTSDGLTIKGERGHLKKNPAFTVYKSYSEMFRRVAGDFGLTPTSRMKLDIKIPEKPKKKSFLT